MTFHKRVPEVLAAFIIIGVFFSLTGCGGGGEQGEKPAPVPTVIGELFVSNSLSDTVSVFDASTGGNVSPLRKFSSKSLNMPTGVAVDTIHNEIFAVNSNKSITVYARTADRNAIQIRTIFGTTTGLDSPRGITIDTKNDEILVLNSDSITVYRRTADGDVPPLRIISDSTGELGWSNGITVDPVNNEILVTTAPYDPLTETFHSMIAVYARTANGNTSPVRTISGGSTDLSTPGGIAVDIVNNEIFVTNNPFDNTGAYHGNITVYQRTANGNAPPVRTISESSVHFGDLTGIVVDNVNNEVFVTNFNDFNDSVIVYARTADGNATPLRTISGNSTGLSDPRGIALDMINNEIFVANDGLSSITVYSRASEGDHAPVRMITAGFAELSGPQAIAVDSVTGEVFVLGFNIISVYAKASNGNVAPLRTFSIYSVGVADGIAIDTVNREVLVTSSMYDVRSGGSSFVTVYAINSSGDTLPIRTIAGSSTQLSYVRGLAVDSINQEIFILNGNNSITVYPRTADGNAAPLRTISGASTALSTPISIAIDPLNNELVVANSYGNSITVYGRTSRGNITPLRTITGASTGLNSPSSLAVDTFKNEIYVSNTGFDYATGSDSGTITIYARTANGNAPPLRTISGGSTGLNQPSGIAGTAQ